MKNDLVLTKFKNSIKNVAIGLIVMNFFVYSEALLASDLDRKLALLQIGKTSKSQVIETLGQPSEDIVDGERAVLIYSDTLKVPFLVSFIPVIGDIADGVELIHKNRELIIQFDGNGLVYKHQFRDLN